jgi:hypothetical protein
VTAVKEIFLLVPMLFNGDARAAYNFERRFEMNTNCEQLRKWKRAIVSTCEEFQVLTEVFLRSRVIWDILAM